MYKKIMIFCALLSVFTMNASSDFEVRKEKASYQAFCLQTKEMNNYRIRCSLGSYCLNQDQDLLAIHKRIEALRNLRMDIENITDEQSLQRAEEHIRVREGVYPLTTGNLAIHNHRNNLQR